MPTSCNMRKKKNPDIIELPDGRKVQFTPLNIDALDTVCDGCMFDGSESCKIYSDILGTCVDRDGKPGNNGIFTEIE